MIFTTTNPSRREGAVCVVHATLSVDARVVLCGAKRGDRWSPPVLADVASVTCIACKRISGRTALVPFSTQAREGIRTTTWVWMREKAFEADRDGYPALAAIWREEADKAFSR